MQADLSPSITIPHAWTKLDVTVTNDGDAAATECTITWRSKSLQGDVPFGPPFVLRPGASEHRVENVQYENPANYDTEVDLKCAELPATSVRRPVVVAKVTPAMMPSAGENSH